MFIHSNIADARPLMVVGAPRCGTRFVVRALNQHPKIHLNGEIPHRMMRESIRFFEGIQAYLDGLDPDRPRWRHVWERERRELLYGMWGTLLKRPMEEPVAPVSWFGHKTPRHDRFWQFYHDYFPDLRPKYVFCMREFIGHYLSSDAMEPKPIAKVAREYRRSINRYAAMKATLRDDVSLFILDDLEDGGRAYLRTSLFENLGIEVDDSTIERLDPGERYNSSASAGRSVRRELTSEEEAYLEANWELTEGVEALREARTVSTEWREGVVERE